MMQLEKERHAEFSRFFNALHSSSSKIGMQQLQSCSIVRSRGDANLAV